ncbi:transglycosylase SLT domain-containing protein [Microbacterium excoecariae]|uniref:aggregation-promoting factor C-terminal-like domain-containing protein n=1 Tax=Microbacterium excoecariae TaxID=2715210 RepID=UPI00140D7E21|nr:transglycosylase SLT domain-containing protein [Microbacterium excoecariae]NHI16903.1 transglycosylase SLT domain-containing protein [Microbacterium excoecariae]
MTRREARSIERSAIAEARRTTREVAVHRRRRDEGQRWSARRIAGAVVGGVAAAGFLAASLAPVVGSQVASASQDPAQTTYATAADEAQLFAASEKGGSLAALATVSYEAELRTPEPEPEPEVTAEVASATESVATEEAAAEETVAAPIALPTYSGGGSKEDWMTAAGIASSDWAYVDYIVSAESGWNPNATNASSGACGLVQALPCSKVPGNGYDPVDNLAWGSGYAVGRYGSWAAAYQFWVTNHWW